MEIEAKQRMVAPIKHAWYIMCLGSELKDKPIARELHGIPFVLFRDQQSRAAALLDRCPHRNVPLSLGRNVDGELECGYHGWRFDGEGKCRGIPGMCGGPEPGEHPSGRNAKSYPVIEQDGYVWMYPVENESPQSQPYQFPYLNEKGYSVVRFEYEVPASVYSTAENTLDVPHTSILHKGVFRGSGNRETIEAVVKRDHRQVECQYIGEPRPEGIIGKLLSPSGGVVSHWDRFILPSITQVEYSIGTENHIVGSQFLTPVQDDFTKVYLCLAFRLRVPKALVRAPAESVLRMILKQDVRMLQQQTDNVRRFKGEQFVSTELDLLGPHIWRLLKQAERGESAKVKEVSKKAIKMTV